MDNRNMLEAIINACAGGNQAQFARELGESPQNISAWIRRGKLDVVKIYKLYSNLNPHWLLTGEGEMLNPSSANEQNRVSTGDYSPVNLHGTMEVRQTTMADTSRELELLRAQLEEKERVIQAQRELINEKQKMIDLLQR